MRGNIQQRSKGSWRLRYDGPPDLSGKRKQITETVKGTKKAAEQVLRERLATIETGGYVPKDKETVAQFMQRWLDTYAATNTRLRTQEGYKGNIRRYIIPAIGHVSLQGLTARHVQRMYSDLLNRGLSATTVLHVHRLLRKSISDAVKWGLLTRNVADAATPPRREQKEPVMWDAETVDRFMDAAKNSRFYHLYHLAVLTGMRRSELAGLKWENVDLVAGRLSIVNTLQRIPGHGLVESTPKTARSRRSVALKAIAINSLHSIRGRQIEEREAAGTAWRNTGYVFTQADGTLIDPESITRDFRGIVDRSGLPYLTLHGLRHAHATLALAAGVNPKIVSERLGHSTIAVTMDTYSHVLPGMQEEAAQAVENLLEEAEYRRLERNLIGQNGHEMVTNSLESGNTKGDEEPPPDINAQTR